ncbi:VCBS repeat-containing protein [Pricia sp. S334]|uniref:VCBS repeat-containing protein n=1 Tax=Pricia mediterranea TaxID=3076079 RepID=A0ABU3L5W8_9FLAO|nr:VCBS repeat-containing protein [Pricia sp. S334]MDT7829135.1 VCBS repeat-containing protein [Pricia sp. S334]
MNKYSLHQLLLYFIITFSVIACQRDGDQKAEVEKSLNADTTLSRFTQLPPDETRITFENTLAENLNANVLMYEYLYNGGGVATGDFNGDGLIDIYFSSNMGENKFYLNLGEMKFEEVTQISKVAGRPGPWKTGTSATDVNGDGKLDLYLCYSGMLPPEKRKNQLFINMGNDADNVPIFEERASQFGLDSPAFSNQGYFFDYDRDGDLDMLLLNHNPKSLPVLNEVSTQKLLKVDDPLRGIRLFRQEDGKFVDVTTETGINGSELTYGLGIGISDINNDGWMDFYVSNDYTVPDYLYFNNKDGTFTDKLQDQMGHTSHFSMGNDIADINNDGWQDIYTLDMLPEDNRRQKLLLAPDNYEKFDLNLRSGFHFQYMRNMLQLNNGNGTFSEIGQLAGISNTDWSWAPLFADYNNDGLKDLFVTNGYFRDYTNLDFINYMDNYVKSKGRLKREDVLEIIKHMPSSNLANYFYINQGGLTFSDETKSSGLNHPANSNGAAYADLDNDGDLDLIVNNINSPAFIYRNDTDQDNTNYLQLKLKGADKNSQGIGSRISVYTQGKQQHSEQIPTRGYLSTVSPVLHFGLGNANAVDSLTIRWNTGKQETLTHVAVDQRIILEEKNANRTRPTAQHSTEPLLKGIRSPIAYQSVSSPINDFKRQSLLTSQLSHTGPCMVKGDINNDGIEDVFVGGSKGQSAALFIGQQNGRFSERSLDVFEADKNHHDADAVIFDANQDAIPDIYVASGGYHNLSEQDPLLQDRLYLGDGKGNFRKNNQALPQMRVSKGCVTVGDVNGDGAMDVFVGGRVVPGRYPEIPKSYLLINDGHGDFSDQTENIAPELRRPGMVTDALWYDLNGDNQQELILVGEWMPISAFSNTKGKLLNTTETFFDKAYRGWWNTLTIDDLNGDGRPDIIAGNMGTNTQFTVSENTPAELYYKDFDQNGSIDPLLTYYIDGVSYPYLTRDELLGQLSGLRSRFNSYESYADATIVDIFPEEALKDVKKLQANHMETSLFLSTANHTYKTAPLPLQAQFAPVHAISISDLDGDGKNDILLFGNNDHFKLRLGKFDANYGMLLSGDGKGRFEYVNQLESGLNVRGSVQSAVLLKERLLLGIYGKPIKAYQIKEAGIEKGL